MYKWHGWSRSHGPILLKELLNTRHEVTPVEIRSAFYPPDQVKFDYSCNLWINCDSTRVHISASKGGISSTSEPVLCRIGISLGLTQTQEHQQAIIRWLMMSYTKDFCCYYGSWFRTESGCAFPEGLFYVWPDYEETKLEEGA